MNRPTERPSFYLWAWSLYPVLVPFYLMGKNPVPGKANLSSGVPQLADYYLAAVMGLVFANLPLRLVRPAVPVARAFAGFVAYTALVNLAWAAALEDLSLLKNTLFYAYDLVLFVTCLQLYSVYGERFLKATLYAVAASVVLQAVLSPLAMNSASSRQSLFFNDENQLGYYCVLAATVFVMGSTRFAVPLRVQVPFYGALAYIALLSQCRGAFLGLGLLAALALVGRPYRLFLVALGLATAYLCVSVDPPIVPGSGDRIAMKGEYDTPETRGYDRILNHPEHTLFGAGEGAYERFRSQLFGSEIHSSFGTLLFCYGLLGAGLFTLGLLLIVRNGPLVLLYLIPAFVYGFAHHGVRFAFFWATLAFLFCTALAPAAPPPNDAPGEGAEADLTGPHSTPIPERATPS